MDARRLRTAATVGAVGLTVAVAGVVAADPFPSSAPPATPAPAAPAPAAAPAGGIDPTALAVREARALARLQAAETLLRSQAAAVPATAAVPAPAPAAAPAPVVSVAPAPVAPVTSSGSS